MRNDPISVGNRRLLKLAAFLEELPSHRFNYAHWVDSNSWKGKADLSCGTTACALGWATAMPEFRKLGLRLVPEGDKHCVSCTKEIPNAPGDKIDRAAYSVFHLQASDTQLLFIPEGIEPRYNSHLTGMYSLSKEASAKEVAAHIRKFVATPYRKNGQV